VVWHFLVQRQPTDHQHEHPRRWSTPAGATYDDLRATLELILAAFGLHEGCSSRDQLVNSVHTGGHRKDVGAPFR
jgi:hypothetical protein